MIQPSPSGAPLAWTVTPEQAQVCDTESSRAGRMMHTRLGQAERPHMEYRTPSRRVRMAAIAEDRVPDQRDRGACRPRRGRVVAGAVIL
jgi:hypothetical protein